MVRQTNADIARELRPYTRPVRALGAFIDTHRRAPGFGFEIDIEDSGPIPEECGRPITTILFARWMCDTDPAYRVVIQGEDLTALRP